MTIFELMYLNEKLGLEGMKMFVLVQLVIIVGLCLLVRFMNRGK